MQINGAKWWKFDFHTHTPVSKDYGKGPNFSVLQSRTPREWLLDYMNKEIDCVAVTDHNSGEWIDILKNELEDMKAQQIVGYRDLIIFPGVEISVNGNVHVLAIFDPELGSQQISNLLSRCEYNGNLGDSDGCTVKSFNDVIEKINSMNGLAIPAHVDIERGLFKEIEGVSLNTCLHAKGLLAMQVCNVSYTKPALYNESGLKLTEVAGSDSHHPETVGGVFTWVKMEHPNLDALRLALHDGEDGIIRSDQINGNPNDIHQRFFIKSIEIKQGAKAGRGQPLKIALNPWFNAIIGGRGSGKSSIIEYMRLPLDKISGLPKKVQDEFNEFNKIPTERGKTGMLTSDTSIRVEMYKDGREVALEWNKNMIYEEHLNQNGEWVRQEQSGNIDKRFPLRIFSQKHLYSLTEDSNHILYLIDQQFDKEEWNRTKLELEQEFLKSRSLGRELKRKISEKGNLVAEYADITAKMKVLEDSGHKELLERYQKIQIVNNNLNNELSKVNKFVEHCESLKNDIPTLDFTNEKFIGLDEDSIKILHTIGNEINSTTIKYLDFIKEMAELRLKLDNALSTLPWQKTKNACYESYKVLVTKLEELGEKNPNAYGDWVIKRNSISARLIEIDGLENQLKIQDEKSNELYRKIINHEKELRRLRNDVIGNWRGTNDNVRIYLKPMGDMIKSEKVFRSLIRKENEFARDILNKDEEYSPIGGLIYDIANAENPWDAQYQIISRISQANDEDSKGFSKVFIKYLKGLFASTPEDFDRLIIWFPEDKVELKLVSNRKEEDIETGSAGQRTAAMLSLMLLLDDSPIIIDQPEEDLDTKRITDLIVSSLREFKKKQQVIVVTHNPNIPVNGGAENIIQMNFAGGQINKQVDGALQKSEVRKAVCEVMEGGKDALDKRYFRISKALD